MRNKGGVADGGVDRVVGLDLVSRTKESGLYSGGSGEPLKGFEEGSDVQIPF